MASQSKTRRVCPNGHTFYKSSDCPTCEAENAPASGFLAALSAPARRALESIGATTLTKLARYSEREILQLHGMGPRSMPTLRQELLSEGLTFRDAADTAGKNT